MEFTHFDSDGNARMVDVGGKTDTDRIAAAKGSIKVSKEVFDKIKAGQIAKGDVLNVATVAGIMGLKRTFELIPMCHSLNLNKSGITWHLDEKNLLIECTCTAGCHGKTGVEMEALTGASIALLTVYDMCKALDKAMVISDIRLIEKDGGKSGHYIAEP